MMHICAWCRRAIGILPGRFAGQETRNYGICPACLRERLTALEGSREAERTVEKVEPPAPRVAA